MTPAAFYLCSLLDFSARSRSPDPVRSNFDSVLYSYAGAPEVEIQDDGWTALTADRSLSAQYEHTLEVTDDGVRVLTIQNDEGTWEPPGRWLPPGFDSSDEAGG